MKQTLQNDFSLADRCAAAVLLLLSTVLAFREIYSPDIGFHLRAGEWILEQLKFPGKDPFSYGASQHDYVDMYWLYQLFVALVNKISGEFGLVLTNALLVAASFAMTLLRVRRKAPADGIAAWPLAFFAAIWALALQSEPRPHTFSWLYLTLALFILDEYYEKRGNRLFLLPLIMLVWANTHTLFVLGWFVIGAYGVSMAWRDRKVPRPFLLYALLALTVPLVNPYGITGIELPFVQFRFLQMMSVFKDVIAEYVSPLTISGYTVNGHFVLFQPLFSVHIFLALSLVALARRLHRVQLHEIIIFGIFFYLAISGIKNIGIFIFAALPMTVWGLSPRGASEPRPAPDPLPSRAAQSFSPLPGGDFGLGLRRFGSVPSSSWVRMALLGSSVACSLLLMLAVATNAYYLNYRSNDRFGYRYNPRVLPDQASLFLRENRLEGKILNHFNFGGFLIHAIPQRVYVDGRNEVMGEELFGEYYTHWNLIDKGPILDKYRPDIVIFPYQNDFLWVHYFRRDSTYRLVYADELSAIYLRRGYAPAVPAMDPNSMLRGFPPITGGEVDSILARGYPPEPSLFSLQPRYFPQREIGLSTFCYYNDQYDAAIRIGLHGLRRSTIPCPELYYDLGNYFWEGRDFQHAARCYERLLKTNTDLLAQARLEQIRSKGGGPITRMPGMQ